LGVSYPYEEYIQGREGAYDAADLAKIGAIKCVSLGDTGKRALSRLVLAPKWQAPRRLVYISRRAKSRASVDTISAPVW